MRARVRTFLGAKKMLRHKSVKPPNILVLVPKEEPNDLFVRTKETLEACVGFERYVIYPLPYSRVTKQPWKENCALLVVPNASSLLLPEYVNEVGQYVGAGGRCLSMNIQTSTHILNSISKRPCIETVDSSGERLMTVSPLDPRLKLFYSLKCVYNPERIHLSEESIDVNWTVMSLAKARSYVREEISIVNSDNSLTANNDSEYPCVWLVSDPPAERVSVVSFLELVVPDVDASHMSVLEKLKETGEQRHEFLKNVFDMLGLECGSAVQPSLTHIYLVSSSPEYRESFIKIFDDSRELVMKGKEVSAVMIMDDYTLGTPVDPPEDTTETRSVIVARPRQEQMDSLRFCTQKFFNYLKTKCLGRCLLVGPVVTSTQTFFTGNFPLTSKIPQDSGLLFVAGQQTKGRGRGGNVWISPKGCLMFSIPLIFPSSSRIVKKLSMLQHIVGLSVVSAIRTKNGYEKLPVQIKWPNDIYYSKEAKLGGIIVSTISLGKETTAIIGCGVNVDNEYPTVSLNDCIRLFSKSLDDSNQRIPLLTLEETLALVMNKLEMYLALYEEWGFPAVEELYYKYWMHMGAKVEISGPSSGAVSAIITGIDQFGYLRVRTESGEAITLQPDGNTFDIMKGLIRMK